MNLAIFNLCTLIASVSGGRVKRTLILSANTDPLLGSPNLTTMATGLFEAQLVQLLSQQLKFTYEIRPPEDVLAIGMLNSNGRWTGGMGQIQRKEIDAYVSLVALSSQKYREVDFTFPVFRDDAVIIVPFPAEGGKNGLIFAPFPCELWIAVGITLLAILILLLLIAKRTNPTGETGKWMMFNVAVLTGQDFHIESKRSCVRLVIGSWMLCCIVLVNGYTAVFTSMLTAPSYTIQADSIEDVVADHLRVHIFRGSSTQEYILNSPEHSLKLIAQQLLKHPLQSHSSETIDKIPDLINGRNVFITSKITAVSLIARDCRAQMRCRLTLASKRVYARDNAIILQKNSPLTPLFNIEILRLHQSGLLKNAVDRATSSSQSACSVGEQKRNHGIKRKLQLRDLSGAFVVLSVGMLMAMATLVLEVLSGTCRKTKRNRATVSPINK